MRRHYLKFAPLGLVLLALIAAVEGVIAADEAPASKPDPAARRLFVSEIQPLLEKKCIGCHGAEADREAELDLRTLEGMLKGGESEVPSLVPGKPEESPLFTAVLRDGDVVMPPQERNALTPEEIDALRRWIAAGAPWLSAEEIAAANAPADSTQEKWTSGEGVTMSISGGLSPAWSNRMYAAEDVWAYLPIQRYDVPWQALEGETPANAIDAFILTSLLEKDIDGLAPPADRPTLIRRLTFDLTGLPPTSAEVMAFVEDDSPQAYAKLIKRLMDSPHYGEQLARQWLDVTRYADTSGFANDYERPNAWRYRDYVIRSFNSDKPFDRFIVEQIAGDELDPFNPENLIAAGFLRMGPWEQTGMSVKAVTRQLFLDDVTNHVGVTFLGQGMRCCQCHDHKFDPLPTRDYYRLQACFAPVQFADRDVPFLAEENTEHLAERMSRTRRLLDGARSTLEALSNKSNAAVDDWLKEHDYQKFEDVPKADRPQRGKFGLTGEELSEQKIAQKRKDYFERASVRYEPLAFSLYDGPDNDYSSTQAVTRMPPADKRQGTVEVVHILTGGSLEAPGERVTPGVVSAVAGSNDTTTPSAWNSIPHTMHGRRLALARWIASANNTLTARVIVNRIWQRHFGKGLVATPNNFGKMGAKPTHPELLDYLATWFIDHGWSIKQLDRLILTSRTWQQASQRDDDGMARLSEIDARNDLLAYFPTRRLAAEELRDSLLAITGELNAEMSGPGVFPEINWEVARQPRHIMGSIAPAYIPDPTPAERHRRSIYAFRIRTLPDPLLEVFNRPGADTSCDRRDATTVTPQVFAWFNSQFVNDRALALARASRKNRRAGDVSPPMHRRRTPHHHWPTASLRRSRPFWVASRPRMNW